MVPYAFTDSEATDNERRIGNSLLRHSHPDLPVWTGTLATLERQCRWEHSRSTLLRTLHLLKPEWIDFEVQARQRAPWTIKLTGLSMAHCVTTASPSMPEMTQSSASPPASPSASDGSAMPAGDADELRHETERRLSKSKSLVGRKAKAVGEGTREERLWSPEKHGAVETDEDIDVGF
jgi:hypothetical protein